MKLGVALSMITHYVRYYINFALVINIAADKTLMLENTADLYENQHKRVSTHNGARYFSHCQSSATTYGV